MFEKFLAELKGNQCWVATPSGIYHGNVSVLNDETFVLSKTLFYLGKTRLHLENATIIIKSVIAWGTTTPAIEILSEPD